MVNGIQRLYSNWKMKKFSFQGFPWYQPICPLIFNEFNLKFAMTINKSQGQSSNVCGLNREIPFFFHGQLYVACSCVGKASALYVLAPINKTKTKIIISGGTWLKRINLNVYIDIKKKLL